MSRNTYSLALLIAIGISSHVWAQGGLRESLEKLDVNQNGEIEPDEITPLARPYLERIAAVRRMPLSRPQSITQLQEAARIYAAIQNGVAGKDVRPVDELTLLPFGPEDGKPLIPEFGISDRYPYTQEDLDEADRTIRRYDYNRDGYIDRQEASRSRWTHRSPFDMDLNKDKRLSRLELTQRYARRRLLDSAADELSQKSNRTGSGVRPVERKEETRRESSQWWRQGGSRYYLTASVMGRFDTNKNGRLEIQEAKELGVPMSRMDIDRDGELSRQELQTYLTVLQDEAGDEAEGIPGWFYELDADRDGQVEMAEFTSEWTDAKYAEFEALDLNGDGLITTAEVVRSKASVGGAYRSETAEVMAPRKVIVSEIEVTDDFPIGDLNVELSVTHSHVDYLDAYLTSPDGQRIELFTEIGGSGDNLVKTVFDDQARTPINKAKPPFTGPHLPEGLLNRQPGLAHFNGKTVKGVWQLTIRSSRSDRFGMLHGWGLIVKPLGDAAINTTTPPAEIPAEIPADAQAAQPSGETISSTETGTETIRSIGRPGRPESTSAAGSTGLSREEKIAAWLKAQAEKKAASAKAQ
jgi:Ca2+-binding EF-hand superfamily protein